MASMLCATQRFRVLAVDKTVFDDNVAELVGMSAAVLMTSLRICDAQIGLCYSMTVAEAA